MMRFQSGIFGVESFRELNKLDTNGSPIFKFAEPNGKAELSKER
jgi:hypothetical protein